MDLLYILIGLILGAGVLFFIYNTKLSYSLSQNKNLEDIIDSQQKEIVLLQQEVKLKSTLIQDLEHKFFTIKGDLKVAQNNIDTKEKVLKEQKEESKQIQEHFKAEFKNLANDILEEKTNSLSKKNQKGIEELINPLKIKIEEFKIQVRDTYEKETRERFSLATEIEKLAKLNSQLTSDAQNLTKALKGDSKVQGDWGEMILENILEQSGLTKGREYFVQKSFDNEKGGKSRPDVVVNYPGNRCVIIDSKVSLTNYEEYISANTDTERKDALKKHIISVNKHVKELSDKNYQDLLKDCKSPDFVMMFLPLEPAYLLAIQNSPNLWQNAYKNKILLISPTNLIAALRMIRELWYQDKQNKNVAEIAKESGSLIDKFMGLLEDFDKIEKAISNLDKSYADARKKLYTGKGNLISKAEKIKKLGAKSKKELPSSFANNIASKEELNLNQSIK
ncbi:MAG: DNA recombination protein RmuC [Bacteroidales bacterium]|nr:DNA recombination protein RmuC [Bacteroidales bacterium]